MAAPLIRRDVVGEVVTPPRPKQRTARYTLGKVIVLAPGARALLAQMVAEGRPVTATLDGWELILTVEGKR